VIEGPEILIPAPNFFFLGWGFGFPLSTISLAALAASEVSLS
jgi:hypothetical protein